MENKNIDQYTKHLMQNAGLEKPSAKFLDNVLKTVSQQSATKIIYAPLISKKTWFLILFVSSAMILGYFIIPESAANIDLNMPNFVLPTINMPHFSISRVALYSIVFLSLFIFQIPILKYYLERRIEY